VHTGRRSGRHEEANGTNREGTDVGNRGGGIYISGGVIALIIIVVLLIWLL